MTRDICVLVFPNASKPPQPTDHDRKQQILSL